MKDTAIFNGIKFRKKGSSWLMKFFAFLLKPFVPDFMTRFWTTLFTTIYVPDYEIFDDGFPTRHKYTIMHEKVHIDDFRKYHLLQLITYIFPPIFLAYGRYIWERRAYMAEFKAILNDKYRGRSPITTYRFIIDTSKRVAESLGGSSYLWAWPKSWIETYFREELFNYAGKWFKYE